MLPGQREKLQVQPTKAKVPLPGMAVCALEVGATCLGIRRDIPTATTFIGDKR